MNHAIIFRSFTIEDITNFENVARWKRYYQEELLGLRTVIIIEHQGYAFGYGSLVRTSEYRPFKHNNIPEIHDVWINPAYRNKGYGRKLILYLEECARKEGYRSVGIGVGLYESYGAAQKLYTRLSYVPDGRGITHHYRRVVPGISYPIDDELIMWLVKVL